MVEEGMLSGLCDHISGMLAAALIVTVSTIPTVLGAACSEVLFRLMFVVIVLVFVLKVIKFIKVIVSSIRVPRMITRIYSLRPVILILKIILPQLVV